MASRNSDKLTPLDIAFMLGNPEIMDVLVNHRPSEEPSRSGATVEDPFLTPEAVMGHLSGLINESKKQVEKFGQLVKTADPKGVINVSSALPSLPNNLNPNQIRECEKQRTLWTKRLNSLRRMRAGFVANFSPQAPEVVRAEVVDVNTVKVAVAPSGDRNPKALITKFKVQWSLNETFTEIRGERVFNCLYSTLTGSGFEATISGLNSGQTYYLRAAFGNAKGYGSYCGSESNPVVPSSWRALNQTLPRFQNQLEISNRVLDKVLEGGGTQTPVGGDLQDSVKVKRKGLFSQLLSAAAAPKFCRIPQPNKLYLCCVLYHEDKVLMTNEDALPLLLVDDLPDQVQAEFHWFNKLSHMWNDIEGLKLKISGAEKKFAVKSKVLNAVATMQGGLSGLGGDLGTAFRVPIVLSEGEDKAVVFSLVRHVKVPKSVVSLSLKWVPMSKAQRARKQPDPGTNTMDQLCYSIREQIIFQQVSSMTLPRGLYVCYVQSFTTVEGILNVIVPNSGPSILPYTKVRENPHVTSEEWSWVQKLEPLSSQSPTVNYLDGEGEIGSELPRQDRAKPSSTQLQFAQALERSVSRLFEYLDVQEHSRSQHRLYDREVIELSPEVSVIIVLPPPQSLCFLQPSGDQSLIDMGRNDLLSVPLTSFEFLHMNAYNRPLLSNFCRSLTLLEAMLSSSKQLLRETLDNDIIDSQQQKIGDMTKHQQILEECWKPSQMAV